MDYRLILTLIGLPIYLALVIYFRRYRQWLLYYLLAAFGLTMLITLPIERLNWDYYLIGVESFHAYLLGQLIGISSELLQNGRVLLETGGGQSILKLGVECSGVLEFGVLIGLIAFYPVFNLRSKILKIAFGLAVTYLINVLRILIIIVIVAKFGTDYVFLAHAVVGRLFFFALAITLYWYILTGPTLKLVGEAVNEGTLAHLIHNRPERASVIRKKVKIATTLIILGLGLSSFAFSTKWHQAFGLPANLPTRPLIYSDQTALEPITSQKEGQVLGESIEKELSDDKSIAQVEEVQEETSLSEEEIASIQKDKVTPPPSLPKIDDEQVEIQTNEIKADEIETPVEMPSVTPSTETPSSAEPQASPTAGPKESETTTPIVPLAQNENLESPTSTGEVLGPQSSSENRQMPEIPFSLQLLVSILSPIPIALAMILYFSLKQKFNKRTVQSNS